MTIGINCANAQINLQKRIERKVVNRTNTRIDQGIDKGLDAVEKDIKGDKKAKEADEKKDQKSENEEKAVKEDNTAKSTQPSLLSYSKYDFIPGEKVVFFDDFSQDAVGDFPALWNTSGSAEVVTTNLYPGKWCKITSDRGVVCPTDPIDFPENFTIEFDVIPQKRADGGMNFGLYIISTKKPLDLIGRGQSGFKMTFEHSANVYYSNYFDDDTPPVSGLKDKLQIIPDTKYRISIWVQKDRIRLYKDEQKIFDLPKGMNKNKKYNMIRFFDGEPMFTNLRIAVGAPDTRSKLITEGKLVTYGIYFDVNKDVVKPESYGTLKSIADVLTENADVRVKIVGHTDADGADAANMDLSKRRAASVKNELVKNFNLDASRIETDGAGETQPVAANDSQVNKALNRRVEFIKL
jgi:outer membrane protein OmpA-like peptidoglycan-associated protein